jgi:hypothetical protein
MSSWAVLYCIVLYCNECIHSLIRWNETQLIHNAVQSDCQPTGKIKRNLSPPHCSHKCCCKLHPTKQNHTKRAQRIRTTDSRCNNSAKASALSCLGLSQW